MPTFNEKNLYCNLFDISCLDSIEQTKENIPLLLDRFRINVYQNIIHSKIFDTSLIKLNNEGEDIDIKYY